MAYKNYDMLSLQQKVNEIDNKCERGYVDEKVNTINTNINSINSSLEEKANKNSVNASLLAIDKALGNKAEVTKVTQLETIVNTITTDNADGSKDNELISARVDNCGQVYTDLTGRLNSSETGALFNYDNSPFAYNVKKFELPSVFEIGYINWSTGATETNTANVRSKTYFTLDKNLTVINKNSDLYAYRVFDYNDSDSTFISVTDWIWDKTTTINSSGNRRKILFQKKNATSITLNEILENFLFFYKDNYISREVEMVVAGKGWKEYPVIYSEGENLICKISGWVYAVDKYGNNVHTYKESTTANEKTFTLAHNQVLVWNLDTNVISVVGNNDAREYKHVILLSNSKGAAQNGYFAKYYDKKTEDRLSILENAITPSLPICEYNYEVISGARLFEQDATLVGDEIWTFRTGADDLSQVADVVVCNKNTMSTYTSKFTHNLGHVASQDYNSLSDAVLIGNGSSGTVKPRIDIIQNASTQTQGTCFEVGKGSVVSIPFYTGSKDIGGTGCCACWGAGKNIIYMILDTGTQYTIYKLLIGMGSNDYSDSTGTDLTKWGTFISGCTDNQYNGTAKILETYTYDGSKLPVLQGMAYYKGHILLPCSMNRIHILKLALNNGKYNVVDNININQYKTDGTIQSLELEGCVVVDDSYILCTVYGDGSVLTHSMLKIYI